MFTIYTPEITERIKFTLHLVFKEHLGIDTLLTDSMTVFEQASMPKMSYASEPLSDELFLWSHPIMSETDIHPQNINIFECEGEPVFFLSPNENSLFPFDVFSVIFYLVTRYEEYLPHKKDTFGRFPATQSIAFKAGFLQKPLADILILKFSEILKEIFPDLRYKKNNFKNIVTYDIDNAYAYKHKGLVRIVGGMLKQFIKLNFNNIKERILVLSNAKPDPNDNYEFIDLFRQTFHVPVYYFILFTRQSKNDHGLSPSNKHFRRLIENLKDKGIIGIHPSFVSASDKNKLKVEIEGLSAIIKEPISTARAHFLMLEFPKTYRNFIENGITDDFTLGYADQPGFRASTCRPFYFFDLFENKRTSLMLHPFAYMDETLKRYLSLTPEDAFAVICNLIDNVKLVDGEFIALWHNENFTPVYRTSWADVYERSLQYAKNHE